MKAALAGNSDEPYQGRAAATREGRYNRDMAKPSIEPRRSVLEYGPILR